MRTLVFGWLGFEWVWVALGVLLARELARKVLKQVSRLYVAAAARPFDGVDWLVVDPAHNPHNVFDYVPVRNAKPIMEFLRCAT